MMEFQQTPRAPLAKIDTDVKNRIAWKFAKGTMQIPSNDYVSRNLGSIVVIVVGR